MALTAWSIINVSSYVPLQIFFKWGCLRLRFSFFCPCQRSGCCFFLYFLVVFLFFLSTRWSPTQLDSTRLDSTANSDSSFYFSFKLDWGPWTTGGSFAFAFRCHRHQPHHEMGSGSAGGVRCGAMQWSRVESSGVEWSGVLERWGLQLGTGKWAAVWNIFHLARWLTGWAAASAMEPPFLPRNPHISSHPSRNPTDNGKPQVLLFLFFFYRLSFGCLVWLVGWLPAWLAGWLAENIFCCRFCFSAFLFYFRSLKVNLERSRKWHCRRFQSANWSYLRGSSFTHRLKWNWKWKGAKRGSI